MAISRIVGHFEILDPLGAGGMGEVFRGRDQRLNREVAIKLLPEAATDAARERFQREALAIAALNHPHICTLYEAGEQEGRPYLVMELLEGETLHARLGRGPVPTGQLVQWASEIADALQTAHGKGILHRDLKPGNIFVTQRGSIKVLDFGLAQFAVAAPDADAATFAGTRMGAAAMQPLTQAGTTLGTFAYMSPEQARGETTDARSDIFSLGVVLYEMAGGRPPFQGRTSADLTAAILMLTPPPPSSLRPELPPRLDDIIAQCLEKDPELRYQSAADLRVGLRRLLGKGPGSSSSVLAGAGPASPASGVLPPAATTQAPASAPPATSLAPASRRGWLWPALAAAVVVIAGLGWWTLRPQAPAAVAELQFRQLTFSGNVEDAAISPDGKFLAHIDGSPQGTSLHLLSIASGGGAGASDVQIMPPAPGCCQSPTFSPDGSSIYFVENSTLMAIPVLGGAVRSIAANASSGAGFSPDGKQIAYLVPATGGDVLMLAQADGTQARMVSDPRPGGYTSHSWIAGDYYPDAPAWSPDGRWIAVDESGAGSDLANHLVLVSASDGRTQTLGPAFDKSASDLAWRPDGSGILFTASIPATAPSQLQEVTYPGGKLVQLTHDLQGFDRATIASNAGGAIALVHSNPEYTVWRQTAARGAFTALPGGGADQDGANGLAWTPDGKIISVRSLAGKNQLWREGGDGPAQLIPANNLPDVINSPWVAPDGEIVFSGIRPGEGWHIWRWNPASSELTDLTPGPHVNDIDPALVGDGKVIAYENLYEADKISHQRVWTMPIGGGSGRALWSGEVYTNFLLALPDQRHVLVNAITPGSSGGGTVTEVGLDGSAPVAVKPREYHGRFGGPYAVTPDGHALTSVVAAGNVDNIWAAPLDGGPLYQITHFTDMKIAAYSFARDGRLAVSRGSANSDAVVAVGPGH